MKTTDNSKRFTALHLPYICFTFMGHLGQIGPHIFTLGFNHGKYGGIIGKKAWAVIR